MCKYTIFFFVLIVSCRQSNPNISKEIVAKQTGLSRFEINYEFPVKEVLSFSSKEKIASWGAYKELVLLFAEQYSSVTPSYALEHSKELLDFSEVLGDSLEVSLLKNRGVYARIHTLQSEVLRLHDMSSISSIKAEEVKHQTGKIVNVISSLNAKINAVFEQEALDVDLDFDESIFGFDSIVPEEYPIRKRKVKRRSFDR